MADLAPDLIATWRTNYGLDRRTPEEAMRWWSDNNIWQAPAGAVAALGLCLDAIARLTYERDEWRDADRAECAENARLRAQIAEMQGERDVAELSRDAAHARLAECESQLRAVALKP